MNFPDGLLTGGAGHQATKVEVVVTEEDGTSVINFMNDNLKSEDRVEYDGNDIVEKYMARQGFLRAAFDANLDYIQRHHRHQP